MTNYTEDYERFWKGWPGRWKPETHRPTKVGKYEAWLEWKRLSVQDKAVAIKVVESGRVKDAGTQYLPDASRWLHRRRWEDFG